MTIKLVKDYGMRGVFNIPATDNFLPSLAAGILARLNVYPENILTDWRIMLPTRRAGRELRDAFLKLAGDKPVLLPRLQSIGDVDGDEIDMHLAGFGKTANNIPHAISPMERLFLLAELTRRKDSSLSIDKSLTLARSLSRLIDAAHTEDISFDKLQTIVPNNLAIHWQETLSFLEIITDYWPKILCERGLIDPADRRNRLMKSLIDFWQEHPPTTPVLAAGSTGSIPTTAKLLKTIADLPQGMVVLPAIDTEMGEDVWYNVRSPHPQATMKNLINYIGIKKEDITGWIDNNENDNKDRRALIRAVMAPASDFANTITYPPDVIGNGLNGIEIIEAETQQEEATTIAVILRSILEDKNKTACFITPDRVLARRVITALSRWGIAVDDSAGGALTTTLSATFMGAILRVVIDEFSPLSLLTFLKHPLCRFKSDDIINILEEKILRGARPASGINGIRTRINWLDDIIYTERLNKLIDDIEADFTQIVLLSLSDNNIREYINALIIVAQNTSGGEQVFWSQGESEVFANFLFNVNQSGNNLPLMSFRLFNDVFHELLSQENFRETDPRHRRILFLGQLESRLIRRDVVILGGLNEGTWPADIGHDPWMSQSMRRDFGLATPERLIGLSAHDFASHLSAPNVIVTRAQKLDGTATVPARWISRLKVLLMDAGINVDYTSSKYINWARVIDTPSEVFSPISAPTPCPPRNVRPQKMSVTAVEKWMNNPYRTYAERILKLRPLSPIDEDVTHADRGSFVHEILGEFVNEYRGELPPNAREILIDKGHKKFAELESVAPHWHYWWPRFVRIVDWFLANEKKWRTEASPWIIEKEASIEIYKSIGSERVFNLTAKADRIDKMHSGGAFIIDYKTGTVPPWKKVVSGLAPQLPLECVIAKNGGWGESVDVSSFAYWRVSGSFSGSGEVKTPKKLDIAAVINAAEEGIKNLVIKFEDPQTPYIAVPNNGRMYDDDKAYAHLARMSEWASEAANENDNGDNDDNN